MSDIHFNPQTGEAVELVNGRWAAVDKSRMMTNPQTGEIAVLDGKEWKIAGRVGPVAQAPKTPEQTQAEYLRSQPSITPPMQLETGPTNDYVRALPGGAANAIARTGQEYVDKALLGGGDELGAALKMLASGPQQGQTMGEQFQGELARLQQQRQDFRAGNPELATAAGVGGVVGSPLNLAGGEFMAGARSTLGGMGRGAALGGAYGGTGGFLSTDGNLEQRVQGAGIGAGIGAGAGAALPMLGAAIAPRVRPEVQALIDKGITPTPGQILGGAANRIEERLSSLPIAGDMMASGRRRAMEQFNLAAANDALAPLGQKTTATAGRELVEDVEKKIGAEYDRILQNVTFIEDPQLTQELTALRGLAANLPDTEAKQFERIIADYTKKAQSGQMSGREFKVVEGEISRLAKQYGKDQSAYVNQLGELVGDLLDSLRSSLPRTNPMQAQPLQAANTAWAKFKRVQRAANYVGNKDAEPGVFTPDQFQSAVKAMDTSKDKGAFARGSANMQDLSDTAKSVLGSKVPNSGTPERIAAMLAGTGGLGLLEPTTLAATGLLTLPYTPMGQQAVAGLLTHQGPTSQALRNWALRLISPGAIGGGAAGGAIATPQAVR